MRIRSHGASPAKVDVQLTSMIDVVFQLLAFFLVTFKVAAVEGDFSLKLPRTEQRGPGGAPSQIEIRMSAGADGDLRHVSVTGAAGFDGNEAGPGFRRLSAHVARQMAAARNAGQESPEVRIAADDRLRYEYVIDAVAAASTFVGEDGRTTPSARRVSIVGPGDR